MITALALLIAVWVIALNSNARKDRHGKDH
jgi:hypothetical protein